MPYYNPAGGGVGGDHPPLKKMIAKIWGAALSVWQAAVSYFSDKIIYAPQDETFEKIFWIIKGNIKIY